MAKCNSSREARFNNFFLSWGLCSSEWDKARSSRQAWFNNRVHQAFEEHVHPDITKRASLVEETSRHWEQSLIGSSGRVFKLRRIPFGTIQLGRVAWHPVWHKLNCARRRCVLTKLHLAQFYLLQIMVLWRFWSSPANGPDKPWDRVTLQNSTKLVQAYKHDLITSRNSI